MRINVDQRSAATAMDIVDAIGYRRTNELPKSEIARNSVEPTVLKIAVPRTDANQYEHHDGDPEQRQQQAKDAVSRHVTFLKA